MLCQPTLVRLGSVTLLAVMILSQCAPLFGQGALAPMESEARRRQRLVEEVLIPSGIKDQRVLDAMMKTERHLFVAAEYRDRAYYDMALPIGDSQTISSPWIVSTMTQALDTKPTDIVLEIGTGSGYQAAVLSPLVKHVYTIEIVESLGNSAKRLLEKLEYKNISVKVGDGFLGWKEHAPYDKIIVTCSPESVPQPLVDQLRDGGLLVIPVGERYQQTLYLMRKKGDQLEREELIPTLFVPMTGAAEDARKIKADPTNPRLINGDFELPLPATGYVDGWYYQRGLTWEEASDAPTGSHVVRFDNDVLGRPTGLLQGLGLDGSAVPRVRLSAWVKTDEVKQGYSSEELPSVTVQFFDEQRQRLAVHWLGPFKGTRKWKKISETFRVPAGTKEAIVSIGMFGATGSIWFDDVRLEKDK